MVRSARNLWRAGDFGVVILGERSPEPITLDGSGVALWNALAAPESIAGLVASLAASFGTDDERVALDVLPLIEQLLDLGVLEVAA